MRNRMRLEVRRTEGCKATSNLGERNRRTEKLILRNFKSDVVVSKKLDS